MISTYTCILYYLKIVAQSWALISFLAYFLLVFLLVLFYHKMKMKISKNMSHIGQIRSDKTRDILKRSGIDGFWHTEKNPYQNVNSKNFHVISEKTQVASSRTRKS